MSFQWMEYDQVPIDYFRPHWYAHHKSVWYASNFIQSSQWVSHQTANCFSCVMIHNANILKQISYWYGHPSSYQSESFNMAYIMSCVSKNIMLPDIFIFFKQTLFRMYCRFRMPHLTLLSCKCDSIDRIFYNHNRRKHKEYTYSSLDESFNNVLHNESHKFNLQWKFQLWMIHFVISWKNIR